MDNQELFLYLKLYNTPNVGNKIALKLLKHFGAIEAVFSASEKQINQIKRFLKDFDTDNLNKMQASQILNRLFCR